MREPKLAKLKGGITSGASLFFNSWVKDVRAVILKRAMSNAEALQLVKDYTEGKARQQVKFYIVYAKSIVRGSYRQSEDFLPKRGR